MTTKGTMETLAQSSVPIPVGISGMTLFGVSFADWVLIGTALLLAFQLIVIAPKVIRSIKELFKGGSDDRNQGAT